MCISVLPPAFLAMLPGELDAVLVVMMMDPLTN